MSYLRVPNIKTRGVHLSAVALTITAVGLAACGDDDADKTAAKPVSDVNRTATDGGGGDEVVLIKTHLKIPAGEVLRGSSIGDSTFCPGGRFRDRNGSQEGSLVRTFRCSGGHLTISFVPGYPQKDPTGGQHQTGPWKVVKGSGQFEGRRGHGRMVVRFPNADKPEGRETFTGTVTR